MALVNNITTFRDIVRKGTYELNNKLKKIKIKIKQFSTSNSEETIYIYSPKYKLILLIVCFIISYIYINRIRRLQFSITRIFKFCSDD